MLTKLLQWVLNKRTLLNIFKWFSTTEKPQSKTPVPYVKHLPMDSFQGNQQNMASMRALYKTGFFQDALGVLHGSVPIYTLKPGQPISGEQSARELGRIEGYLECLEVLQSLCVYPAQQSTPLEADFGADKLMSDLTGTEEKE